MSALRNFKDIHVWKHKNKILRQHIQVLQTLNTVSYWSPSIEGAVDLQYRNSREKKIATYRINRIDRRNVEVDSKTYHNFKINWTQ